MNCRKISLASIAGSLSVLAAIALVIVPDSAGATWFDSEPPDPDPIPNIIVTAPKPEPRDTEMNRYFSEQAEMAYMAELQRLLDQTQSEIQQIDDRIKQKEDEIEERCRTVKEIINDRTAKCEDVAETLNYVCLGAAGALGILNPKGGVAAVVACDYGMNDSLDRCEANPGVGVSEVLGSQIDKYCPDAR